MFFAPLLVALVLPSQQQAPRDPTVSPGIVLDDGAREAALVKQIAASPAGLAAYQQLAKLQEERGAYAEAEATLIKARQVAPKNKQLVMSLGQFYNRQGQFDKTIQMLEIAEALDPNDPAGAQIVATYYWDKAYRDHRLLPAEQLQYVMDGIAATDRALTLDPDYLNALTYKNLLLRMRANLETDPFLKQQLIVEADVLRSRAIELNKGRIAINSGNSGVMLGPPPPPPPPLPGMAPAAPSGLTPVRVGGNIKTPTKVKDVPPVYPPDALAARVTGVIILEVTIDTDGHVYDAKLLRSIPLLDSAALEAVRQWEFTPTELNGMRVPVIMTVTVNFTLQ
ncbi:MAG: TonB family protein [Acidobacteriota bacterium]|nr:TonB family protein [Acidobacteriota bacterium]